MKNHQKINCPSRFAVIAFILMSSTFECFAENHVISGSVGDGPIINASVKIYGNGNRLIRTTTTYKNATYLSNITAPSFYYPLTVGVNDGIDLVTGMHPDFGLRSVALSPLAKHTNVNPFSTMIVRRAIASPGVVNASTILSARKVVTTQLNFGLDPSLVPDPINTPIATSNVAVITKSSEAIGEMIRRVRDHLVKGGIAITGNGVMAALADDLVDGVINGKGGKLANPKISAVSKLVSAQVLIESMSNTLKVHGEIAASRLDAAIMTTHPTVGVAQLTDSVRVNKQMLVQALKALHAAETMFSNAELRKLYADVNSITVGSLPADVESILPPGSGDAIDHFIDYLVSAKIAQLAPINNTNNLPLNIAPVITGIPSTTVNQNSLYSFQPSASDLDSSKLIFSVTGLPSWATFDGATGKISGIPTNTGIYGNIVISVSDGHLSSNLPAFSITVNKANIAPVIGGTPSTSVNEMNNYAFQPTASDADGDTLAFSVANLPAWATFDAKTGLLSGTPASGSAGLFSNIVISVSDGTATASLPEFDIQVNAPLAAQPGTISLSWNNPTARVDQTPISTTDIASSTVYYGTKSQKYTNTFKTGNSDPTARLTGLPTGTYYIAVTSTDNFGYESSYSGEIVATVK